MPVDGGAGDAELGGNLGHGIAALAAGAGLVVHLLGGARVASKLSTLTWWSDTTLEPGLGTAVAAADQVYATKDWLGARQDATQARLAGPHLAPGLNPSRMPLSGLSTSWLEGRCCPLGERGYSRDGKKGTLQIEYGLLTDPEGRPVAVRVLPGTATRPRSPRSCRSCGTSSGWPGWS